MVFSRVVVPLVNVSVSDNQAGTVLSGVTLAPNASTNYSGSYTPPAGQCGPFTNTVTATGTDQCTAGQVQHQAQAVCSIVTSPSITVTKQCDAAAFAGGPTILFKGTSSNNDVLTLVSGSEAVKPVGPL